MYEHLLGMLQNAWLIAAQVELLPMQYSDTPEKRTRKDRTTRIQLLYGYPNYDSYCIRLDLKHKGQGFVHYNNKNQLFMNIRKQKIFLSNTGISMRLRSQMDYLFQRARKSFLNQ